VGYLIVILIVVGSAIAAIPAINYTNVTTAISLEAAMAAFILMSISLLLSTRMKIFEVVFGGLDRLYVAHRRIGYAVLAFILVHYFYTPNFTGLFQSRELNELAKLVGYYAFFALLALILFSIIKGVPYTPIRVPYHVWYFTHRFIGFAYVAIAFHQYFVKKPFDQTEVIAYILNLASLVGVVSFAYTQALSHFKKRSYEIVSVEKHPSATVITARPVGRPLKLIAGQFIVAHVRRSGLREPHPFTVSRIADDGSLSISVKPLGDYTKRLRDTVEAGDILRVEGGYGHFNFQRGGEDQIWVAGGIGVTPFSAMAAELENHPKVKVTMFYCVREKGEAVHAEIFQSLAEKQQNFRFILHASKDDGRLDAKRLAELSHVEPKKADFWFCGPAALRQALLKGLRAIGETPRRVKFEQFEFR
jgi:predicted ferric reductase